MGRGGSNSLWSPGIRGCHADEVNATNLGVVKVGCAVCGLAHWRNAIHRARHTGYRIKPYGQLVLVSLTHYCASTPSLSTSWSRTTLQGSQAPGKSHLKASFPLRCFQRLSLPHIATRQCDWRHNRYTRDASTPVLSY